MASLADLIKVLVTQNQQPNFPSAIREAQTQYPWLKRFDPMALTAGRGPFQSESYMPNSGDNPSPGHYTVQLREAIKDPSDWPTLLGREGVDWLARTDPNYQQMATAFRQSMTPTQLKNSKARFASETKMDPEERGVDFETWLKEAELQEYIGGYLVPGIGHWTGKGGEGQYTPEQIKLLENYKKSLGNR